MLSAALLLGSAPALLAAQQSARHDRAYWQTIAKNYYQVPDNESAAQLAHELSGLLASPDPELRDALAYSILVSWIGRPNILQPDDLRALADEWASNLKDGIGESGTNSLLRRSFSALCLASIAEREAKEPVLGAPRYHQLLAAAVSYLQAERDLRGYDSKLGWIHATAHTSDLLQALAGSSLLTSEEKSSILDATATRLSTAPEVYSQGEQDRVAQAMLAVIRRPDFETGSFDPWLTRLQDEDRKVWAAPITPASLARYQNHTYMLQALAVRLELEPESQKITGLRQRVLGILKKR
jgi:Protein of unknown function (DUF2785)